jgi:endonuclease YncB( thermonuclease family)
MNSLIRFFKSVSFLTLVIWATTLHAAPSTNVVVEVLDGDTIKIRHKDDGGGKAGKAAIHCLRGAAAPHLDHPFGKQAQDRLKELAAAGREITHSGPVGRPYKKLSAVRFKNEKGNLAVLMVSEGLAWVIESELEDKHAKPGSSKKLIDEADALLKAQEEARKAKRGLWADEKPIAPWEWQGREKDGK